MEEGNCVPSLMYTSFAVRRTLHSILNKIQSVSSRLGGCCSKLERRYVLFLLQNRHIEKQPDEIVDGEDFFENSNVVND